MFQLVCILTTGGVILFSRIADRLPDLLTPVVTQLVERKSPDIQLQEDIYKIRCNIDSLLGLIFVIAWRKDLMLTETEYFLKKLRKFWMQADKDLVIEKGIVKKIPDFGNSFEMVMQQWRQKTEVKKSTKPMARKIQEFIDSGSELSEQDIKDNIKKLQSKKSVKEDSRRKTVEIKPKTQPKGKEKTKWQNSKVSSNQAASLDFSQRSDSQYQSSLSKYQDGEQQVQGFLDSDEEPAKQSGFLKSMLNSVKSWTGHLKLSPQDIQPILQKLKFTLIDKNVAEEVARKMLLTVEKELVNSTTGTFQSVQTVVKKSVRQAVTRVLTSGRQIDLIKEILRNKQKGLLFKIVFIGVNGVGKSTNLAKVAYMLKSQGLKVMLAACDTFRSGAVQQLKVHAKALQLPIFQKGYKEDPVRIAVSAVNQAQLKKMDVLLIDTAGRMQEKKALMAQLGQLVSCAKPDLVLFIGEALVGNDAIDQLVKFNQALVKQSDNRKEIDGIILTKFDTIDKKVGAALTMTYTTGKPIVFVGVGQKYKHLKRLNVATVTEALLG